MAGLLDSPIPGQLWEGGIQPCLNPEIRQVEELLEGPFDGEDRPRGSQNRGRRKSLLAQNRVNFLEGCQRIEGQIDPTEGPLQVEPGSRLDRPTRPEGLRRATGTWRRILQEVISEDPGPGPSFGNQGKRGNDFAEIRFRKH